MRVFFEFVWNFLETARSLVWLEGMVCGTGRQAASLVVCVRSGVGLRALTTTGVAFEGFKNRIEAWQTCFRKVIGSGVENVSPYGPSRGPGRLLQSGSCPHGVQSLPERVKQATVQYRERLRLHTPPTLSCLPHTHPLPTPPPPPPLGTQPYTHASHPVASTPVSVVLLADFLLTVHISGQV